MEGFHEKNTPASEANIKLKMLIDNIDSLSEQDINSTVNRLAELDKELEWDIDGILKSTLGDKYSIISKAKEGGNAKKIAKDLESVIIDESKVAQVVEARPYASNSGGKLPLFKTTTSQKTAFASIRKMIGVGYNDNYPVYTKMRVVGNDELIKGKYVTLDGSPSVS